MGSSASSNNAAHRHSLPPTLPGGNNRYTTQSKYSDWAGSRQSYIFKEKVQNPHARSSSLSRPGIHGPLKADHNILSSKDTLSRESGRERYGILRPLSRQKSSSLTDLSSFQKCKDGINDITTRVSERNSESRKTLGFSTAKGIVSDARIRDSTLKRYDEVKGSSPKPKSTFSVPKSSISDIDSIIEGVKNIKTSSMGIGTSISESSRSSRRYRSLSDLSTTGAGVKTSSSVDDGSAIFNSTKRGSISEKIGRQSSSSSSANQSKLYGLENGKANMGKTTTTSQFGCGLVGLRNLGNTCFMNSILQCLCKTKFLREYFFKKHYQQELNEDHAPTKGKLAKAFGQLMLDMWSKRDEEYITPSVLKAEVQKYAVRFSGYHQQDAQEFLRFLIEGIHDDLNSIRKKPVYSTMIDDSSIKDCKKSELYWERYLSREKSMIQDLFVGQLKSTLTCTICDHRSVTYDPFWDLSLPIPSRTKTEDVNINRCFRAFTQEEILDGDEKPTCEKCKKRRKCTKRFLLEIFPKILVIHLKRFSGTRYRTKLDTKVSFPMELNLADFAANSNGKSQNPIYSLYGVSNHMGGTHGGHYTAYCKHPDTDKWHGYNDSRVSEISGSKIVSSSAYVLFYELISNGSSPG